ncbi:hypothetical protein OH76DRAFT_710728 [Lentinus brumalis]|uniref:Uncharacterized protein n=1 Tax=Lentinus brumalis TaxID=2498619 RepID=A0A371D5G4_9APHY|nr:hypothetical protein OH76DRAFT_710728 [Polyporus brumalis]
MSGKRVEDCICSVNFAGGICHAYPTQHAVHTSRSQVSLSFLGVASSLVPREASLRYVIRTLSLSEPPSCQCPRVAHIPFSTWTEVGTSPTRSQREFADKLW